MKILKKTKYCFITLIGLLLLVSLILGTKFYLIVNNKNLPYRNILDNYGYIFIDIKSDYKRCTVIYEGNRFLNLLIYKDSTDYVNQTTLTRALLNGKMIFQINSAIHSNKAIEVNDSIFKMLQSCKVDKKKTKQFEDLKFIERGYIKANRYFEDSVAIEDRNAIIYVLLKNGIMDCKRDCQSGATHLVPEAKKK